MKTNTRKGYRIATFVLCMALISSFLVLPSFAAGSESKGLVVKQGTFLDVLRQYSQDPSSFGSQGLTLDENSTTAAARYLAQLFGYTVGLNFAGEGSNDNYFALDITTKMGSEPYVDGNLQATYTVDILPYHGYANALPQDQAIEIRVYRADYAESITNAYIYHYVWQQDGRYYAVKDDAPYYFVSYNGQNAQTAAANGIYILEGSTNDYGTAMIDSWEILSNWGNFDGVVHTSDCTIVAGQGASKIFGLTTEPERVQQEGGISTALFALSDYVGGDTTYTNGPLVASRQVYAVDTSTVVSIGEALRPGTTYHFKFVYEEALTRVGDWSDIGLWVYCEATGSEPQVQDFVWYGNQEYLTGDRFDPHTIEFNFTPLESVPSIITFQLHNLVGEDSDVEPAKFYVYSSESDPLANCTATPSIAVNNSASISVLLNLGSMSTVSRGVMAQALWELAGSPYVELNYTFSDLPSDTSMAQAITWCAMNEIITGYADGTVLPDQPVTREQAAVILCRYARLNGHYADPEGSLDAYPDGSAISSWAYNDVLWAVNNGILTTNSEGYLAPSESALCGEITQMIGRLVG